jgi:hypothetical protein
MRKITQYAFYFTYDVLDASQTQVFTRCYFCQFVIAAVGAPESAASSD